MPQEEADRQFDKASASNAQDDDGEVNLETISVYSSLKEW
jgi:hypothetical protein